jgi:hypothetical protein
MEDGEPNREEKGASEIALAESDIDRNLLDQV